MKRSTKLSIFTVAVITLPVLLFYGVEMYEARFEKLPVYGPTTIVNGVEEPHHIWDFNMLDQDGYKVSQHIIDDKIAVVNFFFTSCPTICPKMMRNVQSVQDLFRGNDDVHLLSFTVDPKRDDPARLRKFADAYHVDKEYWHLLTGDKKEIYQLARNSFYLSASQGDGGEHDFIHSQNLVLVDKQKRIRGYFDGTDKDAVEDLIASITKLKNDRS